MDTPPPEGPDSGPPAVPTAPPTVAVPPTVPPPLAPPPIAGPSAWEAPNTASAQAPPAFAIETGVWIRACAIIIDSLVWIPISLPFWTNHLPDSPSFNVSYNINGNAHSIAGWGLLASMLLWLAYMTVMEATVGASLGKLLAGQRVAGREGDRPSAGAAIVRNLMRFIDGILFYLVGAIAIWTSDDRQRFGDRLANTYVVARKSDPGTTGTARTFAITVAQKRPAVAVMVLGLAVIGAVVVGTSLVSRAEPGLYERKGISFRYPAAWSREAFTFSENIGSAPEFTEALTPDHRGAITISAYALSPPINDAANILPDMERMGEQLATSANGELVEPPSATTIGGLPAITMRVATHLQGGEGAIRVIAIFAGDTQWGIQCESDATDSTEIEAGCDQVLATIRFE